MVRDNWTAKHAAELIAAVLRLCGAGRREIVPRVQRLVTEELEAASMETVAAGLRGQVDDATVEPSEFRRRAVALDLEFLDRVDDRKERHLTGLRLKDGNTVEQVLVRSRPSAVDPGQLGVRGQRHSGRQ